MNPRILKKLKALSDGKMDIEQIDELSKDIDLLVTQAETMGESHSRAHHYQKMFSELYQIDLDKFIENIRNSQESLQTK